jgi:predicted enzyme related to lactoylglutathione lyase
MLRSVAVVWMPVEDIERAKSFYRDILGLAIQNEDGPWAEVNANELTIGLNGREPGGTAAAGGPVVTFQPEASLEETVSSLKERASRFRPRSQITSGGASLRSRTAKATSSNFTSRRAAKATQRCRGARMIKV